MVTFRLISSGSKSMMCLLSCPFPTASIAPQDNNNASTNAVLPAPSWETTATFRIKSLVYSFMYIVLLIDPNIVDILLLILHRQANSFE